MPGEKATVPDVVVRTAVAQMPTALLTDPAAATMGTKETASPVPTLTSAAVITRAIQTLPVAIGTGHMYVHVTRGIISLLLGISYTLHNNFRLL